VAEELMTFLPLWVLFALFAAVLLSIELGYRIGRRWARAPKDGRPVSAAIEGSILGLMGLLIAFTFYGAGARFDMRRALIIREANAIGTSYLRLDLLPTEMQPQLREDFKRYVRSRLEVYEKIPNVEAVNAAIDRSSVLQRKLWNDSVEAVKGSGPAEKSLVLSTLNEVIDITTDRTAALSTHPPSAVYAMLGLTIVASSALAGYTMAASGARDWLSICAFTLVLGAVMYVIWDYEFPRTGLMRIDPVDQLLIRTLENMD
jgi:hypothetical protein